IVEGVLQKIRRQIEELERIFGVESTALTVDGVPDEAKYPTVSPLKEVVDNIQSQVAKQNQCDRSHRRYIPILSCISLKNVYASFVFILIY
ncbi:unnamed protein product, partial [Brassica oleracea]